MKIIRSAKDMPKPINGVYYLGPNITIIGLTMNLGTNRMAVGCLEREIKSIFHRKRKK